MNFSKVISAAAALFLSLTLVVPAAVAQSAKPAAEEPSEYRMSTGTKIVFTGLGVAAVGFTATVVVLASPVISIAAISGTSLVAAGIMKAGFITAMVGGVTAAVGTGMEIHAFKKEEKKREEFNVQHAATMKAYDADAKAWDERMRAKFGDDWEANLMEGANVSRGAETRPVAAPSSSSRKGTSAGAGTSR